MMAHDHTFSVGFVIAFVRSCMYFCLRTVVLAWLGEDRRSNNTRPSTPARPMHIFTVGDNLLSRTPRPPCISPLQDDGGIDDDSGQDMSVNN